MEKETVVLYQVSKIFQNTDRYSCKINNKVCPVMCENIVYIVSGHLLSEHPCTRKIHIIVNS